MTRLITDWIADIQLNIKDCERDLKEKTGYDFVTLAAKSTGFSASDINRASSEIKIGVIPITTGLGVIDSFTQSVAAVVKQMGFKSFVTESSDIDGIYEAYKNGADIIYLADDNRFIAMNLHKKKVADNNHATAIGYVTALEGIEGSLTAKEVLLLGYGVVGREILKSLQKKGAVVSAYDKENYKMSLLSKNDVYTIDNPSNIVNYRLIIDATSEGGWIHKDMLHKDFWMVAPGIPLSLDEEAYADNSSRVIHDYLQIGVAVMLGLVL